MIVFTSSMSSIDSGLPSPGIGIADITTFDVSLLRNISSSEVVDREARARVRLPAPLLREQHADPQPAGLGEVVVEVVHLHVEDELVAGDGDARGGEVAGGVRVEEVAPRRRRPHAAARGARPASGASAPRR